ncbi:MAG: hypothetical protein JXA94_03045, partial [Parachlamydiales bacterium]|nr:hypothetical protein [Parachlamydiales bacterium]
ENRSLVSSLNDLELSVLEEILYSSSKTSISRLSKDLSDDEANIIPAVKKLSQTDLISFDGDIILVDKKMRKYFEFEYSRFDENFKPDITFITNLLHKIPIHILPIWYSIPKTSNNIFSSIFEKYLVTPSLYCRYVEDVKNEHPLFMKIIEELYSSKDLKVYCDNIIEKYNLSQKEFCEITLYLEYNFICFVSFEKTKSGYRKILSPFFEYQEYLMHVKNTKTSSIEDTNKLIKKRCTDFGFVEDLSSIINMSIKGFSEEKIKDNMRKEIAIKDPTINVSNTYLDSLLKKLIQIKFLEKATNVLTPTKHALEWIKLDDQKKALHLYHHPLNTFIDISDIPEQLQNEKSIREAEKSIVRAIDKGWVYFEDFKKGILAGIDDQHIVKLPHFKKGSKYTFCEYTAQEINFIKKTIFERLFEVGIVAVGSIQSKDCFCVTKLGKTIFDEKSN